MSVTHEVNINYTDKTSSLTYIQNGNIISQSIFEIDNIEQPLRNSITMTKQEFMHSVNAILEWNKILLNSFVYIKNVKEEKRENKLVYNKKLPQNKLSIDFSYDSLKSIDFVYDKDTQIINIKPRPQIIYNFNEWLFYISILSLYLKEVQDF